MSEIIAYIGCKRNDILFEMGNVNPLKTYLLKYVVRHDVKDLKDNFENLAIALNDAYLLGWRDISIMNIEVGLEVGHFAYFAKMKELYPDLILRYSTNMPQACWEANNIEYYGNMDDIDNIFKSKIQFGNILDAYSTRCFNEQYNTEK